MKKEVDVKTEVDIHSSLARSFAIPVNVLADRSVASLEAVVEYMKDSLKLTYHEIAELLKRDDRTIWTCYSRVKKKRGVV